MNPAARRPEKAPATGLRGGRGGRGIAPWVIVAAALCAAPAAAGEYFIESDDYRDGEEIVGKFLGDAEYAIMIEEIERNDESFDWGWVLTPGYGGEAPAAEPKGRIGRIFKRGRSGAKTVQEPRLLGFDLASFHTVFVPPVAQFYGLKDEALTVATRQSFVLAMETLGLKVVDDVQAADLELGLAIVDSKAEGTYAYVARIDPFIEIELRLRDLKASRDLLLLRNQAHSGTPTDAARRYATLLVRFLQ